MTEMRLFSSKQNVCFAGQLIEGQNIERLDQSEPFLHFDVMSNLSVDQMIGKKHSWFFWHKLYFNFFLFNMRTIFSPVSGAT
jgi:hypothetical protein